MLVLVRTLVLSGSVILGTTVVMIAPVSSLIRGTSAINSAASRFSAVVVRAHAYFDRYCDNMFVISLGTAR